VDQHRNEREEEAQDDQKDFAHRITPHDVLTIIFPLTRGETRPARPGIMRGMGSDTTKPVLVRFVSLAGALTALASGDLDEASRLTGVTLTEHFGTPEALRLWRLRASQVATDPDCARWIARAAVAEPEGIVIGHAGFHGPPNCDGMVEIGYSVDPAHRRRGYATAMLRELLRRAEEETRVRTVRATIRPDNTASLATIAGFGFSPNGEQWDEEDGLELIFDRPA
jgi:[ribosomal protein S5]-alanine N-acetyltransferase